MAPVAKPDSDHILAEAEAAVPGSSSSSTKISSAASSEADASWANVSKTRYLLFNGLWVLAMDTATYPLDLLKTRQQYDISADPAKFRLSVLAREAFHKGGFYRGYGASCIGAWPGQVSFYAAYETTRTMLQQRFGSAAKTPTGDFAVNLAAGFSAEIVSTIVLTPSEVIAQQMMVAGHVRYENAPPRPTRLREVVAHVYHSEGLRGFYRGFVGGIATYAPSSAVWFAVYEGTKRWMDSAFERDRFNRTTVHMASGAVAGFFSTLITNPFDVAKTRLQTLDIRIKSDAVLFKHGYWHLMRYTARTEGVRGLLRGLTPRLLYAVPVSAVTFAGYELVKKYALAHGVELGDDDDDDD
eukprot:m.65159 g.65159  ORF g.65159 m.65159 type:complete len:355 (-) comp7556_c0_seq3:308-1372(-)